MPRSVTPLPAPKAVVFDLFRTLICPELVNPAAFLRTNRIAEGLGLEHAPFAEWYQNTKVERNRARRPTFAERIRQYCLETSQPKPLAAIEAVLHDADRFHDEALREPIPEVTETIAELHHRGIRVGVLSNTDEHEIQQWPRSPLSRMVDAVGLSVDTGLVKPEPEAYRLVLRALGGILPPEAVFVGDGESRELLGAKSVGFGTVVFMRGFVVHSGFQTPENLVLFASQADRTIDSIPEVLGLFPSPP